MKNTNDDERVASLRSQLSKYESRLKEYESKIQTQEAEMNELLKYSEMAIVEFTADFRIINSYGAIEKIFESVAEKIERGKNLLTMIYKTTRNTKEKIDGDTRSIEEQQDLDQSLTEFIDGHREEKIIKIIGQNDKSEIFLLIWKIIRKGKNFKSFFKIIPTNTIIHSLKEQYEKELASEERNKREIFGVVSDGITVLDIRNNIIFINEKAKDAYIHQGNKLLRNAKLDGKLFQEILVNESNEEIKKRLNINKRVIINKEPKSYLKNVGDLSVKYTVYPLLTEKKNVEGLVIISKIENQKELIPQINTKKNCQHPESSDRRKQKASERT